MFFSFFFVIINIADATNEGRFFYLQKDTNNKVGSLELKDLTLKNGYMNGFENDGRGGLIFSEGSPQPYVKPGGNSNGDKATPGSSGIMMQCKLYLYEL